MVKNELGNYRSRVTICKYHFSCRMVAEILAYGNVVICRPDGVLQIKKSSRKGSALDRDHLQLLFDQLGFQTVLHEDLTAQVGPIA